ncbi:ATP synthase subunit K, mitochondrial [Madurella fahalii]|uniref:ATP synthase subunit K, mitochondrial n=1 Tax=Madurella fahalii TaxID=1157608 RepID=A0ABQ0GPC0_9PEZI
MVQTYSILGKQVGSHYLAMGILGTLFGTAYSFTGGSKKTPGATPPINASSSDEADFIKNFMEQAEADEKKGTSTKH